jgi:hypothetical protein
MIIGPVKGRGRKLKRLLTYIRLVLCLVGTLIPLSAWSQDSDVPHIVKRYNIFFRINSPVIDPQFQSNERAIQQMKEDVEATLQMDGAVPDSLLILSTASPDGGYEFNRRLARNRALSTEKLLLEMFPQFKDSHIKVEFLEEDWDGLRQVLMVHENFPQRKEMLEVINSDQGVQSKEARLRALKKGWRYLVNNHIYALRNSSITLTVVFRGEDEFSRTPPMEKVERYTYTPKYVAPQLDLEPPEIPEPTFRKTILAARTNLILPGLNFGVEVPIGHNWSVGIDYYYPWAVSAQNKWCTEMLGWFIDGKYWFPGRNNSWSIDSKLKGHAVGVFAGLGYYDFQNSKNGIQGEYVDFGVDYTYAMSISRDRLRIAFNIGLGLIHTLYRPYYPSSDYEDLIKEPGVKYRTTNLMGPTKASISLVYPITIPCENPYIKMAERFERKQARKDKKHQKQQKNKEDDR